MSIKGMGTRYGYKVWVLASKCNTSSISVCMCLFAGSMQKSIFVLLYNYGNLDHRETLRLPNFPGL